MTVDGKCHFHSLHEFFAFAALRRHHNQNAIFSNQSFLGGRSLGGASR
jgi:hypothetical protein